MSIDLEEQYDKIYRYCYMKTQHQQLAEDITQETFLRFLEDHTYREMGKKMAYLYTIARNLCMDSFRKRKTVPLNEEMVQNEKLVQYDTADSIVQSIDLKEALGKLAPEEEELIFLRYVNELPVQQISSILGISRFAVYRRTRECLDKLKQMLGEEEWL